MMGMPPRTPTNSNSNFMAQPPHLQQQQQPNMRQQTPPMPPHSPNQLNQKPNFGSPGSVNFGSPGQQAFGSPGQRGKFGGGGAYGNKGGPANMKVESAEDTVSSID